MRIHEIIAEQYFIEEATQLDEGLKEILLTAGMAGIIAMSALGGSIAHAPGAEGASKPVPVKITDGGSGGGTTAQFSDGSSTVHTNNSLHVYNADGDLVRTVKPSPGADLPGEEAPESGGADAPNAGNAPESGGADAPNAGNAPASGGADAPNAGNAPASGGADAPNAGNAPASGGAAKPLSKLYR